MPNQPFEPSLKKPLVNHVLLAIVLLLTSPWVLADWKSSIQTYSKDV
ncbi:hypothetical protein [Candidatus Regiella insecticola]|nr:hypothetical protein [Candidatus Regiella insecticola]